MQCPPFTKASESSIVLNYDFSNIIITLKTRSILEQAREQSMILISNTVLHSKCAKRNQKCAS